MPFQSIKCPQQEFKMQYSPKGLPNEPACIFAVSMSLDGFTKNQFEICRIDVENYIKAVKCQNNFFKSDLEEFVNSYIYQASDILQCEESNIYELENNRKVIKCPNSNRPMPSKILTYDDFKSFAGIETSFLTPVSCKYIDIYNTADERKDCINELEEIIDYEAQNYFEEQIKLYYEGSDGLKNRVGIKKIINETINKFNCVAKGKDYSFC